MKKILVLIVFVLLIGGGYLGINAVKKATAEKDAVEVMFTVERGPLTINLTETGTIKSRDQHIVKSQVEGRTSIIYVIDEGSIVKKGDLLVELDSSELQDRLVDQQIKVENTEADFVSSKETLEVTKIQNQANIARAAQDNQFAIEDKVKYLDGEWPKLLMKAESDVTLADEDYRRATDEFVWSEKLFKEKYLSETEYRADELSKKRAELQVALAREDLRLLKEFTHTRKLTELDSEIEQKALALERVKREAASSLVQAEARERAFGAELTRQKLKLEKIEDQISKTKITAPADGMVVYATSAQFSWRGDTQPLDEGQEVWERQELIHLPTADSMMVVIRVHETALGKVQLDQEAEITIDALPGRRFKGRVTKIAPLPDATSVFMNPDLKVYDTQIMIDGIYPEIRTGMSCKASILVEDFDDAMSVPIQAVVGRDGESIVYVSNGKTNTPRVVETGLDNNAMVHVLAGLEPGDEVMLTPPLTEDPSKDNKKAKAEDATASADNEKKPETGRRGRRNEAKSMAGSMP
ncbi:MAG: efflux RND transporter periplasmic adaptor subunit [Phycisphaerales bacterium]